MTKMTILEDQPRLGAAQWGGGEALAFGRTTIPRRTVCRRAPFRVGGARRAGGGRRGTAAAREAHAASVSGGGGSRGARGASSLIGLAGARRRSFLSTVRSLSLCAGGCATKRRETSEPGRATVRHAFDQNKKLLSWARGTSVHQRRRACMRRAGGLCARACAFDGMMRTHLSSAGVPVRNERGVT